MARIQEFCHLLTNFRHTLNHLTIGTDSALSGKSERTPTIAFGLIVFSLIKLKPAHVTIMSTQIRRVEDLSKAGWLLFRCNCEKAYKGNWKCGRAGLMCIVRCRCEGGCISMQ